MKRNAAILARAHQNKVDASTWYHNVNHTFQDNDLRSLDLQPPLLREDDLMISGSNLPIHLRANLNLQERQLVVSEVCEKRRQLLSRIASEERQAAHGKTLLFSPDQSLYDGAAELESEGFFDFYNVPAWDTWMLYVEDDIEKIYSPDWMSYLVSWIPNDLVDIVNDSINVNPERCLSWAKDIQTPLAQELSQLDS